MKKVQVKNLVFNEGLPKICVPLIGRTDKQISDEIKHLNNICFDLIEFRVDFYDKVDNFSMVVDMLKKIRFSVNKPILFTYRTKKEGGAHEMSEENYSILNSIAIESGFIDIIDIEFFSTKEVINKLISLAKQHNVKVIMSNHDFNKTPSKDELVNRLVKMQQYDADITKIAVMPTSENDVLTLLSATLEMKNIKGDRPFITISMGPLGVISRLTGELFGSCMTFASSKDVSAPGQLNVDDVNKILNLLHIK